LAAAGLPAQGTSTYTVNQICDVGFDPLTNDQVRCYADLGLTGSASDPDGPGNIILVKWDDVTDRDCDSTGQNCLYKALPTFLNQGSAVYTSINPGVLMYAGGDTLSDASIMTLAGYPLKFQLTVVDVRGQQSTAVASVKICDTTGVCN
jgi:hypothetical protein